MYIIDNELHIYFRSLLQISILFCVLAQSAVIVEYTNCISAVGKDSLNVCLIYGTKQSDGEAPVNLEFWEM